jgi:hypothetical protein
MREPTEQFALNEAAFTLTRMAQYFDRVECVDPTQPIKKNLGLTIQPREGVVLRFHRKEEA